MKGYIFSTNKDLASFSFVNDTEEERGPFDKKWSHYAILHRLINFMKSRGWYIEHDKNVHKIIKKDHWYGRKGDLEFRLDRYPRGFKFEFYQNIVFENLNGGRYDFDKFEKMPYLIKLLFINETRHMKVFLEGLGCLDNTVPVYKLVEEKIKQHFVESCHHPQKSMDEFNLSDLDGQTCKESYNHTDRDKKIIRNGEIKYFRDRSTGRLVRVVVYHNINNMWWAILNRYKYTKVVDFELFDLTPDDLKIRRLKKDKKPKEYLDKKEKLQQSSNKELISELKRRGFKIKISA
ncbi:hypothetical protein Psfp_02327 [Pelotomaculum sp. FP]|uniref:hypothetical protein n=1 Tax=Pelotomaculum sp. FP TaxID=261474 RepID=UPI001066E2AA|nr:hypothetical protein [Pelotomaculum sp. FP]TEB15151.1 hypothetical protein Psfp_02327 [Pelotomaculum sp. FP]